MRQLQLLDHRRNLCQRFVPFSIQLHLMFCNVPSPSLILHKMKEVHVKSEPEAELILHKAKEVHVKSEPDSRFLVF